MVSATPPDRISGHGRAIDRKTAVLAGLLCWAGAAIVTWLVLTGRSGGLDAAGLLFWRTSPAFAPAGPMWVVEMVRDLTALGGVFLRNALALAAVVALLFLRLRREAMALFLIVTTGWLANSAMKDAVSRVRPDIVPHLAEAGGASFPSGHSFNAAVVYLSIALSFATLAARPAVRRTMIGAALAVSVAVAWSRVWLGVHFPTDVMAGWLGGAGWALLGSTLLARSVSAKEAPRRNRAVAP